MKIEKSKGWKMFHNPTVFPHSVGFYQKGIVRGGVTLFYINIAVYDFPEGMSEEYKNMAKASFYDEQDRIIEVSLRRIGKKTTEEIEAFFIGIFEKMKFVPDIHNN
jgi:hypothetical protein